MCALGGTRHRNKTAVRASGNFIELEDVVVNHISDFPWQSFEWKSLVGPANQESVVRFCDYVKIAARRTWSDPKDRSGKKVLHLGPD